MNRLSVLWAHICGLFSWLEEELGPLTEKHHEFIAACELAQLDNHMRYFRAAKMGRPKLPRIDFAKAFLAKAIFNVPNTKALLTMLRGDARLRLLCGWETSEALPSEATFSRVFAEFARCGLGDMVHEAMVIQHHGDRLVGHISRDSTAINGREKSARKKAKETPPKKAKRRRRKKGELPPVTRRIQLQLTRTLTENLLELPNQCDSGSKFDSRRNLRSWSGYKLHVDCADGGIPISAVVTSASVHDSQVALVLARTSATRVTNLYDLMDAAYDVKEINAFSRGLGHIPIIHKNKRGRKEVIPMDSATARRFKERTTAERFNSTLKDNYGGRTIRVRGHAKVTLHLFFGIIAITAAQLTRLVT